jgi:site-specific DNA recombinase
VHRILTSPTYAGTHRFNRRASERIERCGRLLRSALASGGLAFRKAYLRLFVDCVVVSDTEIRIRGPKASLAKMAMLGSLPSAADMVPSFVREWRPLREGVS